MRAVQRILALTAAGVLVAGCGPAPQGGSAASSSTSAVSSSAVASTSSASTATAATALPAGWTAGKIAPTGDAAIGLPAPSWKLTGNSSYMWRDDGRAYTHYDFRLTTQGLADFFFGCSSNGKGYIFRIDTRGGADYSGFAAANAWTSWTAPTAGFAAPAAQWIDVHLTVQGSTVTAQATWPGGAGTATLAGYKPAGTAYGFQGDALAATSLTWVSGLTTS